MHRPLRVPFYLRLWQLVRGLLFYNTVYWRRASDGLNMPSLSAEERERQRPSRNLEIIRPRTRPRAHIEAAMRGELSDPVDLTIPEQSATNAPPVELPVPHERASTPSVQHKTVREDDGTEQVYVKRRRYRRRLVSGGSAIDRGSFLARVFGKK